MRLAVVGVGLYGVVVAGEMGGARGENNVIKSNTYGFSKLNRRWPLRFGPLRFVLWRGRVNQGEPDPFDY